MRRHLIGELPCDGRPFPLAFDLIWVVSEGDRPHDMRKCQQNYHAWPRSVSAV
jgi:hypothetical protein